MNRTLDLTVSAALAGTSLLLGLELIRRLMTSDAVVHPGSNRGAGEAEA